jgi:hypothetical protein
MSDVNTPSDEYKAQAELWALPRALMGGTRAMRKAGVKYLPKEAAESADAYQSRVNRSTLFNGFKKTVKDMTGKVFSKPVTFEDDVDPQLVAWAEDIDNAGRHINVFACDVFRDTMQTGFSGLLTDMPPANPGETLAQEQAAGRRPYICHIKAEDIIGWQYEVIAGKVVLTQLRIREVAKEKDGEFGEICVPQVRVLYRGRWEIWREATQGADKGKWVLWRSGESSIKDKITFAPVYFARNGVMTSDLPLDELADLNVAHWQSQSDQRNILHVARVPILFMSGFAEDDTVEIGASKAVRTSNADADMKYVEHNGAAIEAGDKDLSNLEFQMQTMGLQLLAKTEGPDTATGEVRADQKENSPLAMMATALQDALEQSFGFMAEFAGLNFKAGGSIVVNKDFGIQLGAATLDNLLNMVNSGQISKETFWAELQRRGVLSDSFDPEVEKDRLASEAPALDSKGMPLDGGK